MIKYPSIAILGSVLILSLGAGRSLATGPTKTVVNGKVINSTYTFTNVGVSGPGNVSLDQTMITNLNSLTPHVTLQLVLTGITYTEASVKGDGLAPKLTFTLAPTLGNAGSNLPTTSVTLTAPVIPNGKTETNVVFTLASPIVFAPVAETNPGNTNNGTGTWSESLSNLEPSPDFITLTNGVFNPGSVQNNDFSFSGSVEVLYGAQAVPEPSAWRLTLGAAALLGISTLLRRWSWGAWPDHLRGGV